MNDKTASAITAITAVALKTIPEIFATRRAIKVAKAERKIYEEIIEQHAVEANPEPIRVECERLA